MGKYSGKNTRLNSAFEEEPEKKKKSASAAGSFSAKTKESVFKKEKKISSRMPDFRKKATGAKKTGKFLSVPTMNLSLDSITGFIGGFLNMLKEYKIIMAGIAAGLIIAFIVILVNDFHNVKALAHFKPNVTTRIYDKNGILVSELFRQKREVVPLEKIPDSMVRAFVSIEDSEFYDHYGINIKGIVRAFFINIFAGRIKQGGSTITQQLAKILLTSRKRNIYRKVKEAFISLMIESSYSKDEIMALYLNQIYLGHGAYGVESASKIYFGKHVWELNLAEASLIATLPSAPNLLSPIRHPKRSMRKHRAVLSRMVEEGFITVSEAEKAYLEFWPDYLDYINNLPPSRNTMSARIDKAPWFTEYVRRKLVRKYGNDQVYEKGLSVYTTLDIKKQIEAQNIMKDALERQTSVSSSLVFKNDEYIIENFSKEVNLVSSLFDLPTFTRKGSPEQIKFNNYIRNQFAEEFEGLNFLAGTEPIGKALYEFKKSYLQDRDMQKVEGCIISINQRNGYIETMVGGSEFTPINQLNRTIQSRRQPGSAIKPLLYSAAIESGKFTPATTVLDSPVVYLDNEGGDWLPENYECEYYGLVRLRRALMLSINVVSIRLADALGIGTLIDYYKKLLKMNDEEAKKRIPRNFSIALGSVEVSPFELTRAYAIIANGGKDVMPLSIRYIEDRDGRVIENREQEIKAILDKKDRSGTRQVLKPETAAIMMSMLRSVVESGTGRSASPGVPAGGKTGTTNNWKDAWFVGFTPMLTTGLWIGYDRMGLSLGIGQSGGGVAAPVWGRYMRKAMEHEKLVGFPGSSKIVEKEVCSRTGLLPSSSCKRTIKEIFIEGTVPEKECDVCSERTSNRKTSIKGPRDNISRRQKKAVLKNLRKNDSNIIMDSIGDDLLDSN